MKQIVEAFDMFYLRDGNKISLYYFKLEDLLYDLKRNANIAKMSVSHKEDESVLVEFYNTKDLMDKMPEWFI